MRVSAMTGLLLEWTAPDSRQAVRHMIPEGELVRLGRSPASGLAVPHDMSISREHADVWVHEGQLAVRCLETARNPLLFSNQSLREGLLPAGHSFQIGVTTFRILSADEAAVERADDSEKVLIEQTYAEGELRKSAFPAAQQQIEILASLPRVITSTQSDEELAVTISHLLLEGVPQAEAVAVVRYNAEDLNWKAGNGGEPPKPELVRVATRDDFNARFTPSRRLMLKALSRRESTLHLWGGENSLEFTMTEGLGWAFCAPIRGEGCAGWGMYVSGKGSRANKTFFEKEDLSGDLRFTETLAEFISSVRQVRFLQDQRTQLSAFFSPKVVENLTGVQTESLEPAERDVTVLFCDLRGFSKRSETMQHDLHGLLRSVSEALGIMADGVLGLDGAIADFQGDAVLAFWGWPLAPDEGSLPACRAALRIDAEFRRANENPQALIRGLSSGIGVAHGRALAGKIGTDRQAKIGVFGPVVNQGSRLEGLTKQFGVNICLDEAAANHVRRGLTPEEGRLRFLARVRPKGMETAINVFALYPSEERLPGLTSAMISAYEAAAQLVIAGQWKPAYEVLKSFPTEDGPAVFLRNHLEELGLEVPKDWDGAIRMTSK